MDHIAKAHVEVSASPRRVWQALTDPAEIRTYMFGSAVETDWQPGSAITWSGEMDGKPYQDKGEIVDVQPERRLELTHFSPLTGQDDVPENYHHIVYDLEDTHHGTRLQLTQDGNASEEAARESQENWQTMLGNLKELLERG